MDTTVLDGTDVEVVFGTVSGLVERMRHGEGPFFIEARTTRWPGSYGAYPRLVGGETDLSWAWQPEAAPDAIRGWSQDSDPVLLYTRKLLDEGAITQAALMSLDHAVREEISQAARFALESPLPAPQDALRFAYA